MLGHPVTGRHLYEAHHPPPSGQKNAEKGGSRALNRALRQSHNFHCPEPEKTGIFQQDGVRQQTMTGMKKSIPKSFEALNGREDALDRIKTALVEKKLTQAELADAADCHEKTIQNLLGGRSVRNQTLFDVCMVLGLDYPELRDAWHGEGHPPPHDVSKELRGEGGVVAPTYMGAYTRAAVDQYIGNYLTLRKAFTTPDTIVAYRTEIIWDPEWPSLLFQERDRPDAPYAHRGRLYIPASSMFIHLVSLTKGAMRMIIVSQLDRAGEMRGIITTLNKQGAMFVPVATPIVYARRDEVSGAELGEIKRANPHFQRYSEMLSDTVAQGYARLVQP